MNKVKIDLPGKFIFETEIPVRISDINYGGHLGNDSVLSIVHEARIRFLQSMGYSERDIEGAGIIMFDAAVQYKSESFYGDVLNIKIGISDFRNSGFDLIYNLSNKEKGTCVAIVKTGIGFFNYDKRKVVAIPGKFLTFIKEKLSK